MDFMGVQPSLCHVTEQAHFWELLSGDIERNSSDMKLRVFYNLVRSEISLYSP